MYAPPVCVCLVGLTGYILQEEACFPVTPVPGVYNRTRERGAGDPGTFVSMFTATTQFEPSDNLRFCASRR